MRDSTLSLTSLNINKMFFDQNILLTHLQGSQGLQAVKVSFAFV
jgi:hypothetical protein